MAPTHRRWRTGLDRALTGDPLGLLVLSCGIFPRGSGQAPRTCLFTDFRGVSHVALQPRQYVALGGQARSYHTAAPEPAGPPRCLTDAAPSASIKQASRSHCVHTSFQPLNSTGTVTASCASPLLTGSDPNRLPNMSARASHRHLKLHAPKQNHCPPVAPQSPRD